MNETEPSNDVRLVSRYGYFGIRTMCTCVFHFDPNFWQWTPSASPVSVAQMFCREETKNKINLRATTENSLIIYS